ncbi:MAG: VCBS repeat-containing protein [Alphaproteobacteria bacterium]|nr:VCBS repeat-containing protein [Alphaproteobacteria bacterium]
MRLLLTLLACTAKDDPTPDDSTAAPLDPIRYVEAPLPEGLDGPCMDARLADLNGDGALDVVIAQEFQRNLIAFGDGAGGLLPPETISAAARDSEEVVVGDVDGDGHLDLLFASEDDAVNELYLGDGAGGFTAASERVAVDGTSNAAALIDLDGDGDLDLLLGNAGQDNALLNAAGWFEDATASWLPEESATAQDLELGDVDGDGDADLVVANETDNVLLLRSGDAFMPAPSGSLPLPSQAEETREARLGDVDSDGDLDLFFANVGFRSGGLRQQNRLLLNDGAGAFTDVTDAQLPEDDDQTLDAEWVDLDGDGDLDLVTANTRIGMGQLREGPVRALLNDGAGTLSDQSAVMFPDGEVLAMGLDVEVGDLTGDGLLELYVCSRGTTDRLLVAVRRP